MRLLLVLAMTCAGAAAAQQVDGNAVRSCFANTPIGETTPDCLGAASNACQDQGFDTTQGITQCIQAETAVWDDLLNAEYKSTRAALADQDAALPDTLLTAQRAWIAFRDAECALDYARWQGGSIRSVVFANCMMVMTARRTLELRDMKGN
ncbi:lysozyme inhibitor LprI family protein [Sulfitobacter alexandrii]|nr:lysozyme inhibitor LprI family protein [Sulfitobacter alexandrii]